MVRCMDGKAGAIGSRAARADGIARSIIIMPNEPRQLSAQQARACADLLAYAQSELFQMLALHRQAFPGMQAHYLDKQVTMAADLIDLLGNK